MADRVLIFDEGLAIGIPSDWQQRPLWARLLTSLVPLQTDVRIH